MKITAVETILVRVPMDSAYGELESTPGVVARVSTDEGIDGIGYALTLSPRQHHSLAAATEELAGLLIGEDPRRPEHVHRKLLPDGLGTGGVGNIAAAILDIAVWDLAGKAARLPLYQLLGGFRDRVPVYTSLRLGRAIHTEDLPKIAASLVEQGFRAMKMNLAGQDSIEAEIARVRAVRGAVGPNIDLLADVNSRWTPAQAIRMGSLIDEFRLFWLEDPVPIHNLQGLSEVRQALTTPIATGETLFSLVAFRTLFEARAVDIPMPDLPRVGGITPFLKIAHLAEAFGLPLACHLMPEISAQVLTAVPNGLIVEYVPWAWRLFNGCPQIEKGQLIMSDRPGHGLELNPEALAKYRVPARSGAVSGANPRGEYK